MNVIIPLNSSEEARLNAASQQTGLAPAELIKRLALEHLPSSAANAEDGIASKLLLWQQQDGTPLVSGSSAHSLFAQWAEEDAQMSDKEREAEDLLWQDIEKSLAGNAGELQLRQPGSW